MSKGLTLAKKEYTGLATKKIAIITAQWNEQVTFVLRDKALATLEENGIPPANIVQHLVPGTYELTTASKWLASRFDIDAVIALGCVIQGETRHFDFICQAVAQGLMQVSLLSGKPVIFGVLTTDTLEQALARAGGSHGHKGQEAALSALEMLELQEAIVSKPITTIGFSRT